MENQTDLSQITDTTVLKSMAFDQIQALEQAQQNLRLIQQRLQQVQQQELNSIEAAPVETEE